MIARAGSGWQTILADLSLILFMVMATAAREGEGSAAMPTAAAAAEPVAVWQPGGPTLLQWLEAEQPDPRQQLTVTVRAHQDLPAALAAAIRQTGPFAARARIVADPRPGPPLEAMLTYDLPGEPQP